MEKEDRRRSPRGRSRDSGKGSSRPNTPLVSSGAHTEDYKGLLDSGEEERYDIKYVQKTIFGEVRNIRRFGVIEWVFVILAAITMLGVIGISIERFINIHKMFQNFTADGYLGIENYTNLTNSTEYNNCDNWTCTNDFIFAVVLLVNLAFCIFYCCDGLLRERRFEILGYAVGILLILLYIIINYFVEGEQDDVVKLVRLVLACVVLPQNIILALVVQHRMGYLVLNTIGSNEKLIKLYNIRSLLMSVQKFNLQILANILVLSWVKDGHFTDVAEKVVIFLILFYMVIISYIGWTAVTWESHVLAIVWQVMLMICPGFYIYKVANVAAHWSYYRKNYLEIYTNGQRGDITHYVTTASTIVFANLFGLFCCVLMSCLMFGVQYNFGKGLKEKVPPPCKRKKTCDLR